eukprot:3776217-Prymnesium_polylepis.1
MAPAPAAVQTPPALPPPPPSDEEAAGGNIWPARRRLRADGTLWWLGWPYPTDIGSIEQYAALAFLTEGASGENAFPGVVSYAHRHARRATMVNNVDHTIHFHT